MDIGTDHDFVLLDKKSWSLQSDQQVLFRCDFRFCLTDFGSQAHRPCFHFPARQAFRHLETDLC